MTKSDMYDVIAAVLGTVDFEEKNEALEFVAHEKEMLEAKAVKARERAAEKREKSEYLYDEILGVLTADKAMTIDEIVAALGNEEVTRAKVSARMTRFVNDNRVVKEAVKVEGKKRMTYRLA